MPSVGNSATSVVFEYSGVASSVTAPGPYSKGAERCSCAQRIACGWTMPLGAPVVPEE